MAGDWIKIEISLPDKPEVLKMARLLKLDAYSIAGRLIRVWGWANQQTTDGNADGVTAEFIDRATACEGFAIAMQSVGWLVVSEDKLEFPKFDRHVSESAKARGLAAQRAKGHRTRRNSGGVTPALPEKRREEKSKEEETTNVVCPTTSPSALAGPAVLTFPVDGKGSREWMLTQEKLREYQEAYPTLDVLAEFRRALQWVKSSPENRKTAGGMLRFLTRWLNRSTNGRSGTRSSGGARPAITKPEGF